MADTSETSGFESEPARRPVVAKEVTKPATGTDTVVIGCRYPNGLIIRAFRKETATEATPTGIRSYEKMVEVPGSQFACAGPAAINHIAPNVFDLMSRSYPGGFAITPGCPRDVWENWASFNRELIDTGLIFALGDGADAALEARSRESANKTGLEPIDGENPPELIAAKPHRHVSAIQPGSAENS